MDDSTMAADATGSVVTTVTTDATAADAAPDGATGSGDGPPIPPPPPDWPTASAGRSPAAGPPPRPLIETRRFRTLAGVAAALAVAGLGTGIGIGYAAFSGSVSPTTRTSSAASTPVGAVASGLVDVNTVLGYQNGEAAGTGMVLTSTGEVLTNNHVVDGATSITVTDIGNGRTYGAAVVGYDPAADVAVLQLTGASGLSTVSIGSSSSVSVGESVTALGNAGGTGGTPKVARGTVTALDQAITASDPGGPAEHLAGLIETNAPIQAGDSGGPLIDSSGQVIGMDTAASASSGLASTAQPEQAYAIPISTALSVAQKIENGTASSTVHIGQTAFLGVAVGSPFGGVGGYTGGAQVAGVLSGTPAAAAGLAAGDVITRVDGTTVSSATALSGVMNGLRPGATVTVGWTMPTGRTASAAVQLVSGPVG